jgi:hypothetical protein
MLAVRSLMKALQRLLSAYALLGIHLGACSSPGGDVGYWVTVLLNGQAVACMKLLLAAHTCMNATTVSNVLARKAKTHSSYKTAISTAPGDYIINQCNPGQD